MDFPQTLAAIRTVKGLYPGARSVLIEDKANGSAIIQTLQKEMFCIGVEPKGGKVARVNAVSPAIESGHVYLPRGEPWVSAFVDQFTAFPAGKHDDMVDSATQALSYLLHASGEVPEVRYRSFGGDGNGTGVDAMLDGETCYDVYGENF